MEDIWKLSYNMNIYDCKHAYREANRTVNCLAKKGIRITNSKFWLSNSSKDVILKIIVGLYLIECVGSIIHSFLLLKEKEIIKFLRPKSCNGSGK